jgi:hypothetical protein
MLCFALLSNANDSTRGKVLIMTQNLVSVFTEKFQTLNDHSAALYCKRCNRREDMVTAFDAATLVNDTVREIYRNAENGFLHYEVTDDGKLFVCLSSLLGISSKTTQPLNSNFLKMKYGKS